MTHRRSPATVLFPTPFCGAMQELAIPKHTDARVAVVNSRPSHHARRLEDFVEDGASDPRICSSVRRGSWSVGDLLVGDSLVPPRHASRGAQRRLLTDNSALSRGYSDSWPKQCLYFASRCTQARVPGGGGGGGGWRVAAECGAVVADSGCVVEEELAMGAIM